MNRRFFARNALGEARPECEVLLEDLGDQRYRVTVDEEQSRLVDVRQMPHGGLLIIIDGKTYDIDLYAEQTHWHVLVHGLYHSFEVLDPRAHKMRLLHESTTGSRNPNIAAPMAGRVVQVHVTPGQTVERNEGLLILEAMKMENEIKAPARGVVDVLNVKPGDSVEVGATLLRLVEAE